MTAIAIAATIFAVTYVFKGVRRGVFNILPGLQVERQQRPIWFTITAIYYATVCLAFTASVS